VPEVEGPAGPPYGPAILSFDCGFALFRSGRHSVVGRTTVSRVKDSVSAVGGDDRVSRLFRRVGRRYRRGKKC